MYPINLPNFDIDEVDLELRANKLAYSTQNELYDNLLKLHDSYSDWINDNVSKRKSLPEKYLKISKDIIENEIFYHYSIANHMVNFFELFEI